MSDTPGRVTPLIEEHLALGAHMVEFAGWRLPVRYSDMTEEHIAVREHAGLFDVCHMGEIHVTGEEAADALAHALVTNPPCMAAGKAQYSMICDDDGGIIDDLIVYRLEQDSFMVVANASNADVVLRELAARAEGFRAKVEDRSDATALLALQGPASAEILSPLSESDVAHMRYYSLLTSRVAGIDAEVARTGYTGEDGFELFAAWSDAPALWRALLEAGGDRGLWPCGLGARDTLRLEAGMPLYGNELNLDTNPFEAGLGRIVHLEKPGGFVGSGALSVAFARESQRKKLVGLVVTGRGIARKGYPIHGPGKDESIGAITSGTVSPTLGKPIAMGYVPPPMARVDSELEVEIRGKRVAARVVPLPFYRRQGG